MEAEANQSRVVKVFVRKDGTVKVNDSQRGTVYQTRVPEGIEGVLETVRHQISEKLREMRA